MKKVAFFVLLAVATALLQSMDAIGFNKNLFNVNDSPESTQTDKSPIIDFPDSTEPLNDEKHTFSTTSDIPTPGQSDTATPVSKPLSSVTPLMIKVLKQKYNFSLLSDVPILYPSKKVQRPSMSTSKLPSSMTLNVTLTQSILKYKLPPYKHLPIEEKNHKAAENILLPNYKILSSAIPFDQLLPSQIPSITSTPDVLNNKMSASEVEMRQKSNKNVSNSAFFPSPSDEIPAFPTSYKQSSTDTLITKKKFRSSVSNVAVLSPTSNDNSPSHITNNKKTLSIEEISEEELSKPKGSISSTPVNKILPPSDKSRFDTSNNETTRFKLWPIEESLYEQLEFGEKAIENLKKYSPDLSNQSSLNILNNKIPRFKDFFTEKGANEYVNPTESFSLSTHEILSSVTLRDELLPSKTTSVTLTPDVSNNELQPLEPSEFQQKLNHNLLNSTDALPVSQTSSEQLHSNIPSYKRLSIKKQVNKELVTSKDSFSSFSSNVNLSFPNPNNNPTLNITNNKIELSTESLLIEKLLKPNNGIHSSDKSQLKRPNSKIRQFKLWPINDLSKNIIPTLPPIQILNAKFRKRRSNENNQSDSLSFEHVKGNKDSPEIPSIEDKKLTDINTDFLASNELNKYDEKASGLDFYDEKLKFNSVPEDEHQSGISLPEKSADYDQWFPRLKIEQEK